MRQRALFIGRAGRKPRQKNPTFKTGPNSAKAGQKTRRGVVSQKQTPGHIIKQRGRHKGVVKNPASRNYRKAVRLYFDFHGEHPKFVDELEISVPGTALQVGLVTGIMYKAKMDGRLQEFLHEFTGKSRPMLAASADGRQLLLLGGDYKFTERGIVDGSYSIRR